MKKILAITILLLSFVSCTEKIQTEDSGIQVTSLNLSQNQITLLTGETVKLTYTFEPLDVTDFSVTWQSMDSTVATVDQTGLVTAVAPGSVNILLRATNDVYALCDVLVEEETTFNKMVGNWECVKLEFVDHVTGEIFPESSAKDFLWPGQDDEFYEHEIQFFKDRYPFKLAKDSSMEIGILCVDETHRYIPGKLTEGAAQNTYHGSFDFEGTRYELLYELYELDFKYIEEEDLIKVLIVETDDSFDLIRYYKVNKQVEE